PRNCHTSPVGLGELACQGTKLATLRKREDLDLLKVERPSQGRRVAAQREEPHELPHLLRHCLGNRLFLASGWIPKVEFPIPFGTKRHQLSIRSKHDLIDYCFRCAALGRRFRQDHDILGPARQPKKDESEHVSIPPVWPPP